MRLCLNCYRSICSKTSYPICISDNKMECERCGNFEYLVEKDYLGLIIFNNKKPDFFKK